MIVLRFTLFPCQTGMTITSIKLIYTILNILLYAFEWITDLSVKIIFDNFRVKIIKYNFTLFNGEIFPMWYVTYILAYNSDIVRVIRGKTNLKLINYLNFKNNKKIKLNSIHSMLVTKYLL
jgi:hypothetical protein